MKDSNDLGKCFELYVAKLFRDLGKFSVSVNVHYYFRQILSGKIIRHVQVDVQYRELIDIFAASLYSKSLIECKFHHSKNVDSDEISEMLLKKNWVNADYYIFATNNSYTKNAKAAAKKNKILLYDGKSLLKLDNQYRLSGRNISLEKRIEAMDQDKYPTAKIIASYKISRLI